MTANSEARSRRHGRARPFVLGGTYDFDNLSVKEDTEAMEIRGPIAQKIHATPDGTTIHLSAG